TVTSSASLGQSISFQNTNCYFPDCKDKCVTIKCSDLASRAKEKMSRAVNRIKEILNVPLNGPDEFHLKQLKEM
ncbi:hypothetical protein PMAYCL1PPCAC_13154, partial [Pristionchus mayeri]